MAAICRIGVVPEESDGKSVKDNNLGIHVQQGCPEGLGNRKILFRYVRLWEDVFEFF